MRTNKTCCMAHLIETKTNIHAASSLKKNYSYRSGLGQPKAFWLSKLWHLPHQFLAWRKAVLGVFSLPEQSIGLPAALGRKRASSWFSEGKHGTYYAGKTFRRWLVHGAIGAWIAGRNGRQAWAFRLHLTAGQGSGAGDEWKAAPNPYIRTGGTPCQQLFSPTPWQTPHLTVYLWLVCKKELSLS